MRHGKSSPDEIEAGHCDEDSMVERRNVLKSGLATTFVFAGSTALSLISCLLGVFSSSEDPSEE